MPLAEADANVAARLQKSARNNVQIARRRG
jgi:hypothetical protein